MVVLSCSTCIICCFPVSRAVHIEEEGIQVLLS